MTLRASYSCIKCALLRFYHSIPVLSMDLLRIHTISEAGLMLSIWPRAVARCSCDNVPAQWPPALCICGSLQSSAHLRPEKCLCTP